MGILEPIIAFEMGINGEIGIHESDLKCYGGFDVIYLSRFLNHYRQKRNRIKLDHDRAVLAEAAKGPSEEDKKKIWSDFISTCLVDPYLKYCDGAPYDFPAAAAVFQTLQESGVISITPAKKDTIYEKAKQSVSQDLKQPAKDVDDLRAKKHLTAALEAGDSPTISAKIRRRAEELALREWIDRRKQENADLVDFIAKHITKKEPPKEG